MFLIPRRFVPEPGSGRGYFPDAHFAPECHFLNLWIKFRICPEF